MVSCYAIGRRKRAWMDCPAPKEYFFPARFGWLIAGICSAEKKKHANCSNGCLMCATILDCARIVLFREQSKIVAHIKQPILDCSRKSTIRAQSVSWEI